MRGTALSATWSTTRALSALSCCSQALSLNGEHSFTDFFSSSLLFLFWNLYKSKQKILFFSIVFICFVFFKQEQFIEESGNIFSSVGSRQQLSELFQSCLNEIDPPGQKHRVYIYISSRFLFHRAHNLFFFPSLEKGERDGFWSRPYLSSASSIYFLRVHSTFMLDKSISIIFGRRKGIRSRKKKLEKIRETKKKENEICCWALRVSSCSLARMIPPSSISFWKPKERERILGSRLSQQQTHTRSDAPGRKWEE